MKNHSENNLLQHVHLNNYFHLGEELAEVRTPPELHMVTHMWNISALNQINMSNKVMMCFLHKVVIGTVLLRDGSF